MLATKLQQLGLEYEVMLHGYAVCMKLGHGCLWLCHMICLLVPSSGLVTWQGQGQKGVDAACNACGALCKGTLLWGLA